MELTEGIILKSIKYQENSRIISVITKDGMESLLVRGSSNLKSKNFTLSNELTKIAFSKTKGKGFDIVTTGKVVDNYSNTKQEFPRLYNALEIIEVAYVLSDHIDNFELFYDFLDQILKKVNESEYFDIFTFIFKLKTLYLLGVGPIFNYCVKCHKKEENMKFDFYSGGTVCKDDDQIATSLFTQDAINEIKFLYLTKLEFLSEEVMNKIPRKDDQEIKKFINLYYNHYLGFTSKVDKVLKKI